MGYWLLTTMEICLIFWSLGPNIIHIFFLSLKQCLQIAQVKASQKQNNIIEELLYADTFSYATQLTLSLNPVWWENDLRLQGRLLDTFLLQHIVVRQKSLAYEMCSEIFCIWGDFIISIVLVTLWTTLRAEVKEQTCCTYEVMQTVFNL